MLKNKDLDAIPTLQQALREELGKLDTFLQTCSCTFLLGDNLCALDCSILPKLRHVQVAASHYQKLDIPEEFQALKKYIQAGEKSDAFQNTSYEDEQIIQGWGRHDILKL